MKLPADVLVWIEDGLGEIHYGSIELIVHIRDGEIAWAERIVRETCKPSAQPTL